jgi:hypothetical protein
MKRLSLFCLIVVLFAVSCSNKNDIQNEKLRKDLSTFFLSNLNDSSVLLDSFFLLKIDTVTEKQKLNEQYSIIHNQQLYILDLLKYKTSEMSIMSDKVRLYSMIGSRDLVKMEKDKFEKNNEKFNLISKEFDSLSKVLKGIVEIEKTSDSIKPVAFQAKCLYQIRNKDKSIKRDTVYIILNLNKDIVIRKDFLNLPYVFDYDKFD